MARYARHGQSHVDSLHTPTYRAWAIMTQQCTNPRSTGWNKRGARGITICERWREFLNFYADMGEKPEGSTLDRLDVNGNYEPANCYWRPVIKKEKSPINRRKHFIEFNGQILNVKEWAEVLHTSSAILSKRLNRGWSIERALTKPVKHRSTRH